jgi:hypothetical protein
MFPDKLCAEYDILLLPRNRKLKAFQDGHIYGITQVFNLLVHRDSIIHCKICFKNPQPPVDVGPLSQYVLDLPQRS